jgi:hypothetical protein
MAQVTAPFLDSTTPVNVTPGTFLAKAFVERMPVHIHTAILDAAVVVGGVVMISSAARSLV